MSNPEIPADPRETRAQRIADQLASAVPEDVASVIVKLSDGSEREFTPTPGVQSDPDTSYDARRARAQERIARKQEQTAEFEALRAGPKEDSEPVT